MSFDRNLNLEDVEESPVKKLLENIHLILDTFTNYEHPLGALFLIFILGLIIWGLLGKESRLANAIYGIILSFVYRTCVNEFAFSFSSKRSRFTTN